MKSYATVTEYLHATPPRARAALQSLRKTIKAAAPGAVETISYGMPAFKYEGRALVYYAAFANHCSFFPASTAVIADYKKELEPWKTSKGTIQFTVEKPLPATLVKKLVKARIRQHQERAAKTT